ncbi:MAG: family 78 glycoside hydrolase catalytic domain [Capsulimonadales bacterium]|nr:family 78 glycoside hydrolase catalytic domain [Capsulimonadales bacterium]
MNRSRTLSLLSLLTVSLFASSPAYAGLTVEDLRCEYKTAPLHVETEHPRLFWRVSGDGRGRKQTAYRILAASAPELLNRGVGNLWDSGKVASSETLHVRYGGPKRAAEQPVFWKVRVWDERGRESAWSPVATWTTGLRRNEDWNAAWISKPTAEREVAAPPTPEGANWVWHRADGENPPGGTRFFRATFPFPADAALHEATLAVTADDRYTVTLNNGTPHSGTSWQTFQAIDVRRDLRAGTNTILIEAQNGATGPAGVIARLVVRSQAGERVVLTDATWESATNRDGPWEPVRVIGPYGIAPWGQARALRNWDRTVPYFRRAFNVERPVRRALLHATALGAMELSLNGRKVGDDVLAPGWTDFRKRVRYRTYDVTRQLKPGPNALGAILGDGWYASYLAFTGVHHWYGGEPKLRVRLMIEYVDGSRRVVTTDRFWKAGTGPVRTADLLMGCAIDTRNEIPGWDTAAFDDTGWKPAVVQPDPALAVEPQINEPMRVTETLRARTRTEPKPGVHVYDLGQNLVGWVRLTVDGPSGRTVTLRHAEFLNPDGTLYVTNLRSAKATDTFVLKGGPQTLEPMFTFHGFRYVEVTGLDTPPAPDAVAAKVVHSDIAPTLTFDSDNPLLNRLVKNIDWGFRGNALDVPTDCPQRDERAGWTGDAQVFSKTAMLHRFAAPFFAKWLFDVTDGQLPDGGYPDVAPSILSGGNAAWEDAGVIVTYRLYEMYGDTQAIRDHWASLNRFMDHLAKVAPDGIRSAGAYGDWLLLDGPQQSAIHGTAYYYRCATLMAVMAEAIEEQADALRYRAVAEKVRQAFRERFVDAEGKVSDAGKESQTFYALALSWDLLPEKLRPAAVERLVRLIAQRGNHLATGFIGTPVLLQALARGGRADLANSLLLTETYPSWLYQVKLGATTMWERWDGWLPGKGFQDPGMNSFNHYWLGCVGEWIYTDLAGIDTDGPGWNRVVVRPRTVHGPKRVNCVYQSLRGPIGCAWTRHNDGRLTVEVSVPANVTATVILPAKGATREAMRVTESGRPLTEADGIRTVRVGDDTVTVELESGRYRFVSERPE